MATGPKERDANRAREAFQLRPDLEGMATGKILPFGDNKISEAEAYSIPDITRIRQRIAKQDGDDDE